MKLRASLIGIVIGVLVGLLAVHSSKTETPSAATVEAKPATRSAVRRKVAPPQVPLPPLSPAQRQAERVAEYRTRLAGYPRDSRPLEGRDPIANAERLPPRTTHLGAGRRLVVAASADQLDFGEPLLLRAWFVGPEGREQVALEARLEDGPWQSMTDTAEDDPAGDGVLAIALDTSVLPKTRAPRRAYVRTSSGEEGTVVDFIHGEVGLTPTGRFRARAEGDRDGEHLFVEAEVVVHRGGRFEWQGSLYDAEGEPIGLANAVFARRKGTHWVALRFFGRLLCEHGEDGPYTLKRARFVEVGGVPAPGRVLQAGFQTEDFAVEDFSCETFDLEG